MRKLKYLIIIGMFCGLTGFYLSNTTTKSDILSYEVNLNDQNLKFFWKNENGENYKNFKKLKSSLKGQNKELVFAMNGGMCMKDLSPLGLYIEDGETLAKINKTKDAYGNFYLQPNGIFYITEDNVGNIIKTVEFDNEKNIKYATQSGPMLLINGSIHSKLTEGSKNTHIRNGVGILPDGNILFAMSKEKINFYDFASFFKDKGCLDALYLDGFVSRTYLPSEEWIQVDGNFGVIIAEIKDF